MLTVKQAEIFLKHAEGFRKYFVTKVPKDRVRMDTIMRKVKKEFIRNGKISKTEILWRIAHDIDLSSRKHVMPECGVVGCLMGWGQSGYLHEIKQRDKNMNNFLGVDDLRQYYIYEMGDVHGLPCSAMSSYIYESMRSHITSNIFASKQWEGVGRDHQEAVARLNTWVKFVKSVIKHRKNKVET